MKKVLLLVFALLITVSFVTSGFAQEKAKVPEKPAAAPEKPAAAPEKPAVAAPEKPAAPEKKEAAEKPAPAKPKPKPGFAGEITRADAAANLFTVKGKKETVTFDFSGAKFKGYKSADEIKVGDKVVVLYNKKGELKVDKIGGKKAEKPAKMKKAAFKDVDKNADGKITVEELVIVFVNVTPEQFKKFDKNGDGSLDESEYKAVK